MNYTYKVNLIVFAEAETRIIKEIYRTTSNQKAKMYAKIYEDFLNENLTVEVIGQRYDRHDCIITIHRFEIPDDLPFENHNRMKQFDLEKAKNGAAVCLKDETPVKVLDFDFNSHILCKVKTPEFGKEEIVFCIDNFGECIWPADVKLGKSEKLNVFMAPVYAYMNVFKSEDGTRLYGGTIYPTMEDCKKRAKRTWNARPFCIARVELLNVQIITNEL